MVSLAKKIPFMGVFITVQVKWLCRVCSKRSGGGLGQTVWLLIRYFVACLQVINTSTSFVFSFPVFYISADRGAHSQG